jgi:hypothetical protein
VRFEFHGSILVPGAALQTAVVEAALASFLSPDGADRLEAAISRRVDRPGRRADRLEWNADLSE